MKCIDCIISEYTLYGGQEQPLHKGVIEHLKKIIFYNIHTKVCKNMHYMIAWRMGNIPSISICALSLPNKYLKITFRKFNSCISFLILKYLVNFRTDNIITSQGEAFLMFSIIKYLWYLYWPHSFTPRPRTQINKLFLMI